MCIELEHREGGGSCMRKLLTGQDNVLDVGVNACVGCMEVCSVADASMHGRDSLRRHKVTDGVCVHYNTQTTNRLPRFLSDLIFDSLNYPIATLTVNKKQFCSVYSYTSLRTLQGEATLKLVGGLC